MHTYAYLFSTFLDQNWKAQLHVGILLWESLSGLCLPYCLWPSTLLKLSEHPGQGESGPGWKKVPGAKWQTCFGSAWPDSWLGSGATELGQELPPWAPALRPRRRGSVAVPCVGQDVCSVSRDFWQLLQLWSDSLVFPPTPSFKGGSSLTSHKLSTPFSSAPCRAWSTCHGK